MSNLPLGTTRWRQRLRSLISAFIIHHLGIQGHSKNKIQHVELTQTNWELLKQTPFFSFFSFAPLRKHAYSIILKILPPEIENCQIKKPLKI